MTAADRPSVPQVGDTIATAEQLDALPDGVIVMLPTSKVPAVRFEDVWFVPGFEEGQPSSGLRLPTTVLYVPGEQPGPSTDQALAEAWAEGHRTGWEHCQDGNYGNDHWDDPTPNPYAAAGRAETTTATTEDALDSLPYFTFEDDDVYPDEEFVRKADVARLLATARTRPTREQIDRAVGEVLLAYGEVLLNAANHPDPVAVLGRSIAPLRTKITHAVLDLLRDGAR